MSNRGDRSMTSMRTNLTLGPVPYLWEGEKWRDFYFAVADESPVDSVCIGEVVCSKRVHFIEPYFDQVIDRLQRSGKKVRLAGLALVTLERERQMQARLLERGLPVEASDLSTLWQLKNKSHHVGPLINTYNASTAQVYAVAGAQSICLPHELPATSIKSIVQSQPGTMIEVFAFGRTSLAISARCAHARSKGKTKDNCQFVCGDDPDGLLLQTLDRQSFLTLNGVQTMSLHCHVLARELEALQSWGISSFRLSPQDCDMVSVSRVYRELIDKQIEPDHALEALAQCYGTVPFCNGFYHGRKGAAWVNG